MKTTLNVCDSYSINCPKDCYHKKPHIEAFNGSCKKGSYCNYRKKDTKCIKRIFYTEDEFDHLYDGDEIVDYC